MVILKSCSKFVILGISASLTHVVLSSELSKSNSVLVTSEVNLIPCISTNLCVSVRPRRNVCCHDTHPSFVLIDLLTSEPPDVYTVSRSSSSSWLTESMPFVSGSLNAPDVSRAVGPTGTPTNSEPMRLLTPPCGAVTTLVAVSMPLKYWSISVLAFSSSDSSPLTKLF